MVEEEKNLTQDELQEVAESVPAPDEYPEGQAEALAQSLDDPNVVDQAAVEVLKATEQGADTVPMQAFDKGVTAAQNTIESVMDHQGHDAHHGETTTVFGRTLPFPLYTAVFFALGALTLTEVIIAEVLKEASSLETIKIIILTGIASVKAFLVVSIYMHLKDDSRAYLVAFLTPVIMAIVAILFLLSVPATGGY
ncbi:MAG: hypothetical protein Kow00117_23280 [Phototrophicales bacterium]